MANYSGQSGVLKLDNYAGSNTSIAELRSFSIDHKISTIEDTVMGDEYKTYKPNLNEWSGSADLYINDADLTAYGNVFIGASAGYRNSGSEVTLKGYPGGNTAGYPLLSGNIIPTGFSVKSTNGGMTEATMTFQGTGALTLGLAT